MKGLSFETVEAVAGVDDKAANLEKFLTDKKARRDVLEFFGIGLGAFIGVALGVGLCHLIF